MNWQKLLGFVGAGLTAAGMAVPGPLGIVLGSVGAGALYLARPSQTSELARKLSEAIPGRKTPVAPIPPDDERNYSP